MYPDTAFETLDTTFETLDTFDRHLILNGLHQLYVQGSQEHERVFRNTPFSTAIYINSYRIEL